MLRIVFAVYNASVMQGWSISGAKDLLHIVSWSLFYDLLVISAINFPFLLLQAVNMSVFRSARLYTWITAGIVVLNGLALLLAAFDIFYFPFHLQRADADLLQVLFDPLRHADLRLLLIALFAVLFLTLVSYFLYKPWKGAYGRISMKWLTAVIVFHFGYLFVVLFFHREKLLPNHPLSALHYRQLPLVQNSVHCLAYSIYRSDDIRLFPKPADVAGSMASVEKVNRVVSPQQRNIVLFIMESVSYNYFDTNAPEYVPLPFIDSLRSRGKCFERAYSFAYNSNKAISALLAGLPTVTDVPVYHSGYTSIPHTETGSILAQEKYSSHFFIGDDHDSFGFAKCCRWLGIGNYYCRTDIPGEDTVEQHSYGLHDGMVLDFMMEKLDRLQGPFFSIHYGISTHFPYDLPMDFRERMKGKSFSSEKMSMLYYDHSIRSFFEQASSKPWFNNTVFIFCSDHWGGQLKPTGPEQGFHIPLFIYDPMDTVGRKYYSPVSQLDLVNTVLSYSGTKKGFISYGRNLLEMPDDSTRVVFTRVNRSLYQAIDKDHVLGFNAVDNKAVYLYDHTKDPAGKNNLLGALAGVEQERLSREMRRFLATVSAHYRNGQ